MVKIPKLVSQSKTSETVSGSVSTIAEAVGRKTVGSPVLGGGSFVAENGAVTADVSGNMVTMAIF